MSFVNVDRATPLLLPVDMRDWVAANDSVHFILEAVEHVELTHFKLKQSRSGKAQYPPRMMLALLIYCYSHGIFSSRKIERASYRDVYVRYLTGDTHPKLPSKETRPAPNSKCRQNQKKSRNQIR